MLEWLAAPAPKFMGLLGLGFIAAMLMVAAGCGESAPQKKHKAVETAEKQSSLETKASFKSALPEARHALAQIEHDDTLARFQARRAKRPAPAGHTNEIERLRGWIRYVEAEVSHE